MKEKIMALIKKTWPILAAVAVIGLGAGLLYGAIGKSQADKLAGEKLVSQQTAQPAVAEPVAAPAAAPAAAPTAAEATPSPAAENISPSGAPVSAAKLSYQVVDVIKEGGASPTAADISLQRAGEIAFETVKNVFGYELSGENVYVEYVKFEGVMNAMFNVLVSDADSYDYETGKYSLVMDSRTGALQSVGTVTPQSEFEQFDKADDAFASVDDALQIEATKDAECFKLVRGTVERTLANGREIVEIQCNAVQWAFMKNENSKVCADFDVHMSQGECYRVRVAYPGKYVTDIWFFPLGWESCYFGILDEAELKTFLDERQASGGIDGGSLSAEPSPEIAVEDGAGAAAPGAEPTPTPKPQAKP